MERNKRFLHDLCRRGPEAYDQFVQVLYGVGQIDAARVLRPNFFEEQFTEAEVVQQITSTPPDPQAKLFPVVPEPSGTVAAIECEQFLMKVMECKEAFVGQNIYEMKSNPRGICLIINIYDFKGKYDYRTGSIAEANGLKQVFTDLHFNVELVDNPSRIEMHEILYNYSRRADLRDHNAFVLIVLSHGVSGHVVC